MAIIAHIDLDAFFASVEERESPMLAGSPIVVGADPKGGEGRGVVSTANYIARAYGIRSGIPISRAWRLSVEAQEDGKPRVIFVTPHFEKYEKASRHLMSIISRYVSHIEVAGIDEAYADFSDLDSFKKAEVIARKIQREVIKKERLSVSIGIGPNKMIAKIASGFKKPRGLTTVEPKDTLAFLAPLSVRELPGVGPKTGDILLRKHIRTVSDLRRLSREQLVADFGKWGVGLYEKARGIGDESLSEPEEAKSIGAQETFDEDISNMRIILAETKRIAKDVFERMQKDGFRGFRTAVLTIRFADFETKTRSQTSGVTLRTHRDLEITILHLLMPFLDSRENKYKKRIRLIGVRVEKLA